MNPKKNTHKKPGPAGYFHNNGTPLTPEQFNRLYANANRKARLRIDAMLRRGIRVAPPQKKEAP